MSEDGRPIVGRKSRGYHIEARIKKVMEEVLETQEILADKELMKSIKHSEQDVKHGRVFEWEQLKRELKSKNKP